MGNKGFLTATVIFEAMSLNRDEGMGNIQSLHLLNRGNGEVYTYMSRQAITYAVRKILLENDEWKETNVELKGKVLQFTGNIKEDQEIDIFGYMNTKDDSGNDTRVRPATITFTHAVSLEPYRGEVSMYANHELNRRNMQNNRDKPNPIPYNRQEHKSLYKYSIVIDLNRIGVEDDKERTSVIEEGEKAKRINQVLQAIANLGHQISASRQPLNPLFIVGAHVKYGSPIFHNYVTNIENQYNILDGELLEKGLKHVNNIKKEERIAYSLLKGSGDLGVGISNIDKEKYSVDYKKDDPIDVIEEMKLWVNEIYGVETENNK